jgi:hypothetical protein
LPGVGEALKREIAGLGLVGRLLLWRFGLWACLGYDLTDPLQVPVRLSAGSALPTCGLDARYFLDVINFFHMDSLISV